MGYDLDQFFRVKSELELPGGVKCYLRCLSDAEIHARMEASLLASTRKRQDLRDSESEAYAIYIEPMEFATEEDLRNTILALDQREIAREVLDEIEIPYIPFPDEASLEERQDVVERREQAEQITEKDRKGAIQARVKALKKSLAKTKKKQLVNRCKMAQIQAQGLVAYVGEFNRQTVLRSCFKDEARTEPFFQSAEDVAALPSIIYETLLAEYQTIDRAQLRDLENFFETARSSSLQEA